MNLLWFEDNDKISNTDVNFYDSGEEKCHGGYFFGPVVRDHYIIHYILSGKGFFKCGKNIFNLKEGDGFIIYPGYLTYYQADQEDPWHYMWVGFSGLRVPRIIKQTGLSQDNPTFNYTEDGSFESAMRNISSFKKYSLEGELIRDSNLYLFLSKLISIRPKNSLPTDNASALEEYVKSAIDYIEKNYAKDISVNEISNYIGINRTYFSHIFKNIMSQTPMEYIVATRIDKACLLLKNSNLTIADISNSVGYNDQFVFSKQFKRIMGTSPSKYRNCNT